MGYLSLEGTGLGMLELEGIRDMLMDLFASGGIRLWMTRSRGEELGNGLTREQVASHI